MLSACFLLFGIISVHTVSSAKPCSGRSDTPCCLHGEPYTNYQGVQVKCGRGFPKPDCPESYSCFVQAADKWAVCCPPETVEPEPCSGRSDTPCCLHGEPYTNNQGEQVKCGRGFPQPDCPEGYSCFVQAADKWAVCCPPERVEPAYVAPPPGYTGLRLQTVCLHVDPACAQMNYKRIDGTWYRVCDIPRLECSTARK
ncbi:neurogenic locus Notch protein-like [Pecten maximus]|uniref:neurogenic locus Notch protein-like n=1 Tax=Pecten maximus TaxID=6579 RepID=UPI001458CC46|nr:neurogenic locus Notch protein-like [Pecten maximus]